MAAIRFNKINFEGTTLNTAVDFYTSLSEKGIFRSDYDITLNYDLPLDFYIKFGSTLNYDNQPAIVGNDLDYIFTNGFGWKLN